MLSRVAPLRPAYEVIEATWRVFSTHGGRVLGAATAFYALLSVAPLLLMGVGVAAMVTGRFREARRSVMSDLAMWVGDEGAATVGALLDNLEEDGHSPLASVLGFVLLFWASTRLFTQLRYAINHLWGIRDVRIDGGLRAKALLELRRQVQALAMVPIVVTTVTVLVVVKASLSALSRFLGGLAGWHVLEFLMSFAVLTVLCAFVLKVLPSVKIAWRDVWRGAVVTALLFAIGASAFGYYLGRQQPGSTYGAAGSVVALLLWVNFSAQAFFLGASFTRAYAEEHGRGFVLRKGAVRIVEQDPGALDPVE